MLSAKSSSALAPTVSMEVMRLGSLFLVAAAVPWGDAKLHREPEPPALPLAPDQVQPRLPSALTWSTWSNSGLVCLRCLRMGKTLSTAEKSWRMMALRAADTMFSPSRMSPSSAS